MKNGNGRGAVGDDQWRLRAGRQKAQLSLRNSRDLGDRLFNVGARLEKDLNHRDAIERLRFAVLNIVDCGCQAALSLGDDAVCHLFGAQSAVVPQNAYDGNIDIWKNIRRSAKNNDRSEDK